MAAVADAGWGDAELVLVTSVDQANGMAE